MNDDQNDFMKMAVPAAITCQKQTRVPASVTIAQAILESGWGKTGLASKFNNFFGIKANQSQCADHDYCEFQTAEYENGSKVMVEAEFAQYATPTESFLAHGQLLSRPHYAPAMACLPSVDKFCWALGPKLPGHPEGCGYSTAPMYHDNLMQLIRIYNLTQYDVTAQGASV
jgi:flagellum-specific peptidoglycan hydrolase FlgJ